MPEKPHEKFIEQEFGFLLEKGFGYEYLYEKSSDKSCVYIYRFSKRGAYIDLRFVSGDDKIFSCVVYTGEKHFPSLEKRNKKLFFNFRLKHMFKAPTEEERLSLLAAALKGEASEKEIFGIPLS